MRRLTLLLFQLFLAVFAGYAVLYDVPNEYLIVPLLCLVCMFFLGRYSDSSSKGSKRKLMTYSWAKPYFRLCRNDGGFPHPRDNIPEVRQRVPSDRWPVNKGGSSWLRWLIVASLISSGTELSALGFSGKRVSQRSQLRSHRFPNSWIKIPLLK